MPDTQLNDAEVRILIGLVRQELYALEQSNTCKEIETKLGKGYYSAGLVSIILTKLETMLGALLTQA